MSAEPKTIYDFVVKDITGNNFDMKQLSGKVVMIVNVASKCGFTKQYAELEELYEKYKDQGFVIIGFPCNQFLWQEPGSDQEILTFCTTKYGVTFPMMSKIDVKGKNEHPIYKFLKSRDPAFEKEGITWNFNKFLINKDSTKYQKFGTRTTPKEIEGDILKLLQE